jgi:pyrroloquinoline-quinone synthase
MHENNLQITETNELNESTQSRWAEWLDPSWVQALDETPFLRACREGRATREQLERFLVQQYFYSRHFTRYLCALLSNVVDEEHRRALTENLVDETGLGTAKGIPHSRLYKMMMEKLGVDPSKVELHPATRDLIETMFQSCRNPNPAVGFGALCLGAEAIVPHVYSQIVQGFQAHGEGRDTLEFFYLHIACDDEHALTMKTIIEKEMQTPEQKQSLKCAAARVIAARARFFAAISTSEEDCHAIA